MFRKNLKEFERDRMVGIKKYALFRQLLGFEDVRIAAALVLVVTLAGLEFGRLTGIRMTIADDARMAADFYQPNFLSGVVHHWAIVQGRLQFFVGIPLWAWAASLEDSILYDIVDYGVMTVAHILFFILLSMTSTIRFALFTAALYFTTMILVWDHSLWVCVPLWHYFTISSGLGGLICLVRYRRTNRLDYLVAWSILILFSFFGHEFQPPIFVLATLVVASPLNDLARFRQKLPQLAVARGGILKTTWQSLPPSLRVCAIILVSFGLYIGAFLFFRLGVDNTYEGSQFSADKFNIEKFFITLWNFCSHSSIFGYLNQSYSFPYIDSVTDRAHQYSTRLVPAALFHGSGWWHLVKMAVCGAAVCLLTGRSHAVGRKKLLVAFGMGLVVMILPNLLVALTPKYQAWSADHGVRYYSYTTLSHFGFALALSAILSLVLDLFSHSVSISNVLRSLIVLVFSVAGLYSSWNNGIVANSMYENSNRWRAFHLLMNASELRPDIDKHQVIAPQLWSYAWSTPTTLEYWTQYAKAKYHWSPDFVPWLPVDSDVDNVQQTFYAYSYYDLPECGGLIALLQGFTYSGQRPVSSAVTVLSSRPAINAFLAYQGPDIMENVVALSELMPSGANPRLLHLSGRTMYTDSPRVACAPPVQGFIGDRRYRAGKEIGFGKGGDGHRYIIDGFYGEEPWGQWTEAGKPARLVIPFTDRPRQDQLLTLVGGPYLHPGVERRTVEVVANGVRIATWILARNGLFHLDALLPAALFKDTSILDLTFKADVPNAGRSPGGDLRNLGLGVRSMTIEPAAASWQRQRILTFDEGGNGLRFLARGWSSAEDWGTWSDGDEANIVFPAGAFPAVGPSGDVLELGATVSPFLAGSHKSLAVTVSANAQAVGTWHFDHGGSQAVSIQVPWTVVSQAPDLTISFRIDHPASPAGLGVGTDSRLLGVGLQQMKLSIRPASSGAKGPQ
jgi:hypothetical protein